MLTEYNWIIAVNSHWGEGECTVVESCCLLHESQASRCVMYPAQVWNGPMVWFVCRNGLYVSSDRFPSLSKPYPSICTIATNNSYGMCVRTGQGRRTRSRQTETTIGERTERVLLPAGWCCCVLSRDCITVYILCMLHAYLCIYTVSCITVLYNCTV
jgi:hypothetical protein